MKQIYLYQILILTLLSLSASGQIQIQNGGMENWSGTSPQRPDNWTTTEQALGLKTNRWVFRETLPENMHSGLNAVRLYSDTNSFLPGQVPQLALYPGMIAYGRASYVNGRLITSGLPVRGRPISFSMYVRISHPVTDTATLRLLLTRWNVTTRQPDTLAYERRDIFPDSTTMNQFAFFIDSINYLMNGLADTAHIIISGGHRSNIQTQGNTVWVDDLKFNYPNDQIAHPDMDDQIILLPNPASRVLVVTSTINLFGYQVLFQDVTGLLIKTVTFADGPINIDVTDLHDGSYDYAILDREKNKIQQGSINVMRDR
jgi:hypothetical protein